VKKGTNSRADKRSAAGADTAAEAGIRFGSGPELLVDLERGSGRPLRAQLEDGLREAVRSGRLVRGARLPATRALALDLGVSRRMVVDAYAQLLAEGYLVARRGAGTYVADAADAPRAPAAEPTQPGLTFDFFPGYPDLASFPRRPWLRALREVLRDTPLASLGYPDVKGAPELRRALAGHLRRVRGVAADPQAIVICSGFAQGLMLLARALGGVLAASGVNGVLEASGAGSHGDGSPGGVHLAVEDPGLPPHRAILAAHGARLSFMPVDEHGAGVFELAAIEARAGRVDGVMVTPAHQSPTGFALAAERRTALLEWAGEEAPGYGAHLGSRVVIEDDYDAEYRYDRPPLAAMQGLAPDRVVYMGTASKTLAPALRLGWMVLPQRLVEAVAEQAFLAGGTAATLEQLTLARLIENGGYDRHLRQARRRYRARRDALARAVAEHLPGARVTGVAAGLHAIVRLPRAVDGIALVHAARERSVGVYSLGYAFAEPRPQHEDLVLGYANLSEPAITEGIRRLALAVGEL
jgi:GntR family transcriptional regulator / MocR family aminotransferase